MKNIKKILAFTLALTMLLSVALFASCAKKDNGNDKGDNTTENNQPEEQKPEKIRVITLAGPTGMGMAKLISDNKNGTAAYKYEFTVDTKLYTPEEQAFAENILKLRSAVKPGDNFFTFTENT